MASPLHSPRGITLGLAIRTLRLAAGYSQRAFAKAIDITPSYLSLVENGKRDLSLALLRSAADKLGAPAALLLAAAFGEQLAAAGRTRELEVVERLLTATRHNLVQLPLLKNAGG